MGTSITFQALLWQQEADMFHLAVEYLKSITK